MWEEDGSEELASPGDPKETLVRVGRQGTPGPWWGGEEFPEQAGGSLLPGGGMAQGVGFTPD